MVKIYKDGDKIFNPETGRYVKVTGTIGRRLERMTDEEYNNLGTGAGAGASADEGGVKIFNSDKKKILNPKSNKYVLVTGTMGRKLLRMSNDEYNNLLQERPAPAPKKQVKRPVDLKKIIKEEQAKAIVRGVQRGDEYLERFRQQTVRLFNELPEQVIDDLVAIPRPTHNIRTIARMLINRPVLERTDTSETIPDIPMPALERQETKLQEIQVEDLNVIDEVAERLDDMISELENEFDDVGVEETKMEDVIVDQIQNKRKDRLNEIINNAQEGDLSTDEEWDRLFDELYELEPVQDDKKTFTETWEEFADNLEKMFDEMIAEEKEGEEEKKEEKEEMTEEKQEEKEEMTGEQALEALRQNLENLSFLNYGRGAFQSHISNPDPHLSAYEHIKKHK